MRKPVVLPFVLIALAILFTVAGCNAQSLTIEKGKLKMCGNENIGFLEVKNGKPTGFSAELAGEISNRLGLELDVQLLPFADLFSNLTAGKCDMVMSAITITPDREKQMDFSAPYFNSGQCILVPKESNIEDGADLPGKKVGVIKGTTNQEEAEKVEGIREIVEFEKKPEMFDALIDGELNAVIVDTPFAKFNVKSTGKTRIAKELTGGEEYGIAVKKGNSRLLEEINAALDKVREDGTYDRLYEKYFGPSGSNNSGAE